MRQEGTIEKPYNGKGEEDMGATKAWTDTELMQLEIHSTTALDGEDVVPGFTCLLSELFL
jgi:hypothetical protein